MPIMFGGLNVAESTDRTLGSSDSCCVVIVVRTSGESALRERLAEHERPDGAADEQLLRRVVGDLQTRAPTCRGASILIACVPGRPAKSFRI